MPERWTKKPVTIEAMLFDGTDMTARTIESWSAGAVAMSKPWKVNYGFMDIETLEGTMTANTGDWIIRGVQGEFYPCKPDIFKATYEPATEEPSP